MSIKPSIGFEPGRINPDAGEGIEYPLLFPVRNKPPLFQEPTALGCYIAELSERLLHGPEVEHTEYGMHHPRPSAAGMKNAGKAGGRDITNAPCRDYQRGVRDVLRLLRSKGTPLQVGHNEIIEKA
jgi:hypothetical protein